MSNLKVFEFECQSIKVKYIFLKKTTFLKFELEFVSYNVEKMRFDKMVYSFVCLGVDIVKDYL